MAQTIAETAGCPRSRAFRDLGSSLFHRVGRVPTQALFWLEWGRSLAHASCLVLLNTCLLSRLRLNPVKPPHSHSPLKCQLQLTSRYRGSKGSGRMARPFALFGEDWERSAFPGVGAANRSSFTGSLAIRRSVRPRSNRNQEGSQALPSAIDRKDRRARQICSPCCGISL